MRTALLFFSLAASSIAGADSADYRIIIGGKPVGTVRTTVKHDRNGYFEESTARYGEGANAYKVYTRIQIDPKGNWVRKGLEMGSGKETIKAFAIPKGRSALVMMERGGKKYQAEVKQTSSMSTTDPSARWFLTYTPRKGETAKFQRFDMQRRQWSEVTVKYLGPKSINLKGKDRAGHETLRTEYGKTSTIIYDLKGMPILMDSPDMRLERIYK